MYRKDAFHEQALRPYRELLRQANQEQMLRSAFPARAKPVMLRRLMLLTGVYLIKAGKRICYRAHPEGRKKVFTNYRMRRVA